MHIESETLTRALDNFVKINHKGMGTINLVKGDEYKISITARPEFLPYISYEVYNNILEIRLTDAVELGLKSLFNLKKPDFKIDITYKHLNEVTLRGIGEITNTGVMEVSRLSVNNIGVGDMRLHLHCSELHTTLQGAGGIYLQGEAHEHTAEIKGAGSLQAPDLITEKTTVINNGAGNSLVFASKELYAQINGIGQIKYLGNPSVKSSLNGLGSITPG